MQHLPLQGKKIAILVEHGFEQIEFLEPKKALEQAGAQTVLISPQPNKVKGWNYTNWGDEFPVDIPLDLAVATDYDGLLLPGGVMSPDKLRINPQAIRFVQAFFANDKPVAAICHGPWTLINAGVVHGRTLTSYLSLWADLKHAGANWVDQAVVADQGLVTSRHTHDIPAFNEKMIEVFAQGRHRWPLEREVGLQPSVSPNTSWSSGAGHENMGFDSPPDATESTILTPPSPRKKRP